MTSSSLSPLYCPNSTCPQPRNSLGRQVCEACQTPLIYRFLWATGPQAEQMPVGTTINDRYYVLSSQVWLDSRPGEPPEVLDEFPDEVLPYLHLYPERLHIPEVYGLCQLGDASPASPILLLDNVPVDIRGQLYPSIAEAWTEATAVRQVYWLWQILQLWEPLAEEEVAESLLVPDNLRVEGWRVRLLQLYSAKQRATLRDLAECWQPLIGAAHPQIQPALEDIFQLMRRSSGSPEAARTELNQLLLEQAALLPLHLEVAGATDTGPHRSHNEDTCYPLTADLQQQHPLIPYLTVVCDGVGGHDGGEVASQLAVQSFKPLIQNLLTEIAEQPELSSPAVVSKQLEELVRVVNNVIAAQNNEQGRELRQRMGTTLVMALQLPQHFKTAAGDSYKNGHELYLVHVGDSRAYWITETSCQRLTVDDDVATREVRLGHSLYWEGLKRPDAGALTQALGTRDGEYLSPTVRRFIVEEDGLLLLCSDGLSDSDWGEKSWANYGPAVLNGEMSLQAAVKYLIDLANEQNGHDNTSVVMTHCRVSPEMPVLFNPTVQLPITTDIAESELSEASKVLLYGVTVAAQEPGQPQRFKPLVPVLALIGLLLVGGFVALSLRRNAWQLPGSSPPVETPQALPK